MLPVKRAPRIRPPTRSVLVRYTTINLHQPWDQIQRLQQEQASIFVLIE